MTTCNVPATHTPREVHLFAGCGGGILGGHLLGHRTVCAVEIKEFCHKVLLQRQRDGLLPAFPLFGDIKTFDGLPWRDLADIVCGGFPCTDITWSWNGPGLAGERSGLWWEMFRVCREILPKFIFIENVGNLRKRGLDDIKTALQKIGYRSKDINLEGSDLGSPQHRTRVWILATRDWEPIRHASDCIPCDSCEEPICPSCEEHYSECPCPGPHSGEDGWRLQEEDWGLVAYPDRARWEEQWWACPIPQEHAPSECPAWWAAEPGVVRVANGVANRVDRITALGNGQIPAVAAIAYLLLKHKLDQELLKGYE